MMAHKQLPLSSCTAKSLILASTLLLQSTHLFGQGESAIGVEQVVIDLESGRLTWEQARTEFGRLPKQDVLESILVLLSDGSRSFHDDTRSFLYETLAKFGAANSANGLSQLQKGLDDPVVCDISALALLELRGDAAVEVIPNMGAFLKARSLLPGTRLHEIIQKVSLLGDRSEGYLDPLRDIVFDERAKPDVRRAAASTMLKIRGLGGVVDDLNAAGGGVTAELIRAVGAHMAEAITGRDPRDRGDPAESSRAITAARRLILDSLRSSEVDFRRAAFESLIAVYGKDIVIIRSPTDYELDGEVRAVLSNMANEDSDPTLRQAASNFLSQEHIDRRVKRILRDRARRELEP